VVHCRRHVARPPPIAVTVRLPLMLMARSLLPIMLFIRAGCICRGRRCHAAELMSPRLRERLLAYADDIKQPAKEELMLCHSAVDSRRAAAVILPPCRHGCASAPPPPRQRSHVMSLRHATPRRAPLCQERLRATLLITPLRRQHYAPLPPQAATPPPPYRCLQRRRHASAPRHAFREENIAASGWYNYNISIA